ncbi:DUF5711 family protein [Clostridiisalibacter paucivorans]|uniref:DUF5711 family protein n=1 Tax=Clostridiisalibacter paucivorans TaxID=408753 RepID=UPI00047B0E4E|nr:DUF5711 family protein [Clostridiisalibacter paucivorans]
MENKGIIRKILMLVLLLTTLFIVFLGKPFKNKILGFLDGDISIKAVNKIDASNVQDIDFISDILIIKGNEDIKAYDIDGAMVWSKDRGGNKNYYIGNDAIYESENKGNYVKAYNNKGKEIWNISKLDPIDKTIESNGGIFAITKTDNGFDKLILIDKDGNLISNCVFENESIIGAYYNEDSFCATTLNIENEELKSTMYHYDLNGKLLWEVTFKNQIIAKVSFLSDRDTLILSDEKIMRYNKDKLLWSKEFEGILKDAEIADGIYLLFNNSKDFVESIDFNGKTQYKNSLNIEGDSIFSSNRDIFIIGDKILVGYDNNKGSNEYIMNDKIEDFAYNDRYVALLSSGTISIISIK